MRKFRGIVLSNIEPTDTLVLWYHKNTLLYYNNGTWQEFVRGSLMLDTTKVVNSTKVKTPDLKNSEAKQLYTSKNDGYTKELISPITTTDAVYDKESGTTLKEILNSADQNSNHIFVLFVKDRVSTRLSINSSQRRKGLEVTFVDNNGTIFNQLYLIESILDADWVQDLNWKDISASELEWKTINNL